jgi:hypothetical protein
MATDFDRGSSCVGVDAPSGDMLSSRRGDMDPGVDREGGEPVVSKETVPGRTALSRAARRFSKKLPCSALARTESSR